MPMHTSTTQALVRPNFAYLTERKPQPQSRGRRRIEAFYLPGDVFGLEIDDEHHFFGRGRYRLDDPRGEAQRADLARQCRRGRGAPALDLYRA